MIDYGKAREALSNAKEARGRGTKIWSVEIAIDWLLSGISNLIPDETPVVAVPVAEDLWNFHTEQSFIPISSSNPFVVPVALTGDRVARAEKRMAELEAENEELRKGLEALRSRYAAAAVRIDELIDEVDYRTNDYHDMKTKYEETVCDLANKLGEALLPNELVRGPDGRYWEVLARGWINGHDYVFLRSGVELRAVFGSDFGSMFTPIYKTLVAEAAA